MHIMSAVHVQEVVFDPQVLAVDGITPEIENGDGTKHAVIGSPIQLVRWQATFLLPAVGRLYLSGKKWFRQLQHRSSLIMASNLVGKQPLAACRWSRPTV